MVNSPKSWVNYYCITCQIISLSSLISTSWTKIFLSSYLTLAHYINLYSLLYSSNFCIYHFQLFSAQLLIYFFADLALVSRTTFLASSLTILYLSKLNPPLFFFKYITRLIFYFNSNFYLSIPSWYVLTQWSTTLRLTKYTFIYPLNAASHTVPYCRIVLG